MASQTGFNTVKSTPSECRRSEPTTAAAAAPIVHRRNQDGPISHGATSRYAHAPITPTATPRFKRLYVR